MDIVIGPKDGISYKAEQGSMVSKTLFKRRTLHAPKDKGKRNKIPRHLLF